jgi:hypothetical protein
MQKCDIKNIFVITPDQNDSDSLVQNVTWVTMELPKSVRFALLTTLYIQNEKSAVSLLPFPSTDILNSTLNVAKCRLKGNGYP